MLALDFPLHHLIDAHRPEFADNYHREPDETHSHGPIIMALPAFEDVIASIPIRRANSISSLKNGNPGNMIETKSVIF